MILLFLCLGASLSFWAGAWNERVVSMANEKALISNALFFNFNQTKVDGAMVCIHNGGFTVTIIASTFINGRGEQKAIVSIKAQAAFLMLINRFL